MTRNLLPLIPLALTAACNASDDTAPAPEASETAAPAEATPSATPTDDPGETTETVLPESAFPASYRALGTEPFWSVHVSEDSLRYMTPENPDGVQVPMTREQSAQDESIVSGEIEGKPIKMRARVEECSDGMSDRLYPYTVTVTFGEQELRGCARTLDG
ncbi:COG3650 family protein [Croceicoccus naphthovorans]|uniref:COG3650 family protein n=1 Tax=Croceicoccus naphthovorans TaxID=1348774 RepID=UPI000A475D19|nr:hypothetical protein [Croceicoccus naphthovorans]MBB3989558.1 putative membrane protein [Croceicoccus naphthovorans]